ncbi:hypothetical protein [Xenorhabdus bovienii]|uniref:hypothetical protein n=1 Tax=Xenorhabdus bovienii TaxID=40576 RepID=UPI0021587DE3|nr:hypothetical protein [Xenorhabdus bovienii]
MSVMRCKQCNELSFADNDGEPAKQCLACGSFSLCCDHSGATFNQSLQQFICDTYNRVMDENLNELRAFARANPLIGLPIAGDPDDEGQVILKQVIYVNK